MNTPDVTEQPEPPTAVRSSDLLAELRDTCYKLDQLMEQSRGPGRHWVFMSVSEARRALGCAAMCEDKRIKANGGTERQEAK